MFLALHFDMGHKMSLYAYNVHNTRYEYLVGIGVPDDVAAGGREGICPENAVMKPE